MIYFRAQELKEVTTIVKKGSDYIKTVTEMLKIYRKFYNLLKIKVFFEAVIFASNME